MERSNIAVPVFVAGLLAFCLQLAKGQDANSAAAGVHEITVTAKNYEFSPSPIHVKQGEHVRLLVTSTDHEHGLKLAAFNIDQKLPKGEQVKIEFTADKVGTFPITCSVFCGFGHRKMKAELVVDE